MTALTTRALDFQQGNPLAVSHTFAGFVFGIRNAEESPGTLMLTNNHN